MTELHRFRSEDGKYGLSLPAGAVALMLAEAKEAQGRETGGILIGLYNVDLDTAIVTVAAAPPPDSTKAHSTFWRGVVGVKELLHNLWKKPIRTYYLGEWHVHPGFTAERSDLDDETMCGSELRTSFNCAVPILVLLGGDPHGTWHLQAWAYPQGQRPVPMLPEV